MEEKRQASIKQVQFLEIIEQRTGVKFNGVRWLQSDVSEYLEQNAPKKQNNDRSTNQYRNNDYKQNNQKQSNKITDKQRQYIKVLENKTGAFFNGKTFEDAENYIKEHRG